MSERGDDAASVLADLDEALGIAQLGLWTWAAGSQVMTWSPALYAISGQDPATFTPTIENTIAMVHPDERASALAKLQAAAEGESGGSDYRIVRPDGEVRHLWVKMNPVLEDGRIVAVRGVSADVTERRKTEARLAESEANYRHALELNPQVPWVADATGNILEVSPRWREWIGLNAEETAGLNWIDALHPDDYARTAESWTQSVKAGAPVDMRYRLKTKDGEYRWFRARGAPRRDDSGAIIRWYGAVEDIDEQVRMETALRETEERYRLAALATNDLIWDHDLVSNHIAWNETEGTRFGYATAELGDSGTWWLDQIHPSDRERVRDAIAAVSSNGAEQFVEEYRFRCADGSYADVYDRGYIQRDGDGRAVRLVGAMQDVTERKRATAALMDSQARLRWGATHDALTGIANRVRFQEVLAEAIAAVPEDRCVGLVQLDVDGFKQINDTLGHDAGDAVLRTLVRRIGELLRPGDTLARMGGDEFAIVLPSLGRPEGLEKVVERIQTLMREPFVFEGHTLDCRTTIGSSLSPHHGRTPEELLKSADIALASAKAAGRGQHVTFDPAMRVSLQHRNSMLNVARDALAYDWIVPHYQPKVVLADGRVAGFEALLRWRDSRGVFHGPGTLGAAFEDLELAAQLSDRMFDRCIADMRRWMDEGVDFGHVALNAAAAEFRRDDFAEGLIERLRAADIPTDKVQLEVTESVFLGRGAEYVERALRRLYDVGVRMALDDFGTGYASLRHLNQFPVDILKIDQSFVQGMAANSGEEVIVRSLVNLGQSLGIEVVAEGIEEEAQAEMLRRLGCHYGQGFFFAKAVPAEAVPGLIAARR
ncbi:EAL domain-containing protein [Sphingoaurantiacus capsulatus]|uniref:EAL domain-containing protein n=1 Tax=Sphingoaurantiacus capsulatus TaxID=1771310 RepID=A0ABV7X789_9SPHN